MTVGRAVAVGTLVVNGPVLALCLGPLAAFALAVERGVVSRDWNAAGLPIFVVSVGLAWVWWALTVPRWRTWAMARVEDRDALRAAAVAVGLTWPEGLFEGSGGEPPHELARATRRDGGTEGKPAK